MNPPVATPLKAAARIAEQLGATVLARLCDVRDPEQWAQLVRCALDSVGRLDHLVNNAGTLDIASISDSSPEVSLRVLDVNATGVYLGMRAVLPAMFDQCRGSIVNVSSLAAKKGMVNFAEYCALKAAPLHPRPGMRMK